MAYIRKSWVILGVSTASALALALGCGVAGDDGGESAAANLSAEGDLVISQVFSAGGNADSPLKQDYVELFNRSKNPVSLAGKALQFAKGDENFDPAANKVDLPAEELQPGQYYLLKLKGAATPAEGAVDLAKFDTEIAIDLTLANGKLAIVKADAPLAGCGGPAVANAPPDTLTRCPAEDTIDLIGWGRALDFEGNAPAPKGTNKFALLRDGNGCIDKGENSTDFKPGTEAPAPHTKADKPVPCPTEVVPPGTDAGDAGDAGDGSVTPERDAGKDTGADTGADSGKDAGKDSGKDSGKGDGGKKPRKDGGDDDDDDDDDGTEEPLGEEPLGETGPKPPPKKAKPLKVGSSDCAMTNGPIDNSSGVGLGLGLAFALVSVGARRRARKQK
jgi:hypothetical protein